MNQAEKVAEVEKLLQEIYLDDDADLPTIRANIKKLAAQADALVRRM